MAKIGFNIFAYLDSEKKLILKEIFDPLRNYILNKNLRSKYLTCEIKIENKRNTILKQEINKFVELGILKKKVLENVIIKTWKFLIKNLVMKVRGNIY